MLVNDQSQKKKKKRVNECNLEHKWCSSMEVKLFFFVTPVVMMEVVVLKHEQDLNGSITLKRNLFLHFILSYKIIPYLTWGSWAWIRMFYHVILLVWLQVECCFTLHTLRCVGTTMYWIFFSIFNIFLPTTVSAMTCCLCSGLLGRNASSTAGLM